MKPPHILLLVIFILTASFSKAASISVPGGTPLLVKFLTGDKKDGAKGKGKKADDDKMKRTVKPGTQNKSKRADEQKPKPPRTIIVV
jgi:hypothetical protein